MSGVLAARHARRINMMKKNLIPFFLTTATVLLFVAPILVFAQTQIITANIPGTNSPSVEGPGAFVANFYEFALMIGGVLAFGIIVYGGVKYMASAGNPSGQSDAKEWIEAALLGLLLLVGAYFILNVINPQLLNLKLPTLTPVSITVPTTPTTATSPTTPATGCAGSGCQNLASAGMTCKPASEQPNGQASCAAAPEMISTLQCIQNQPGIGSSDFTVTEAMPPTVAHESSCHQDGCCVDTAFPSKNPTCAQIGALQAAVTACGGSSANEYGGCASTQIYPTTDGGNVHINSAKGNGC
jgi:hypothetical protein